MEPFWQDLYPDNVPKTIDPSRYQSLTHLLNDTLKKNASKDFSTCMGVTHTYKHMDELSICVSAWLQSRGVPQGTKVAIMMPNVSQYFPTFVGVIRGGYTITSVNPLYTPRELKHQLIDSGAKVIFILDMFCHTLEKVIDDTQLDTVVVSKLGDMLGAKGTIVNLAAKHIKKAIPTYSLKSTNYQTFDYNQVIKQGKKEKYTQPKQTLDDLGFLQYTGGTTGLSKGVLISHRNVVSATMQFNAWFEPGYDLVDLNKKVNVILALPLYHLFALVIILLGLDAGFHYTLVTNPRDIDGFVKLLKQEPFHIFPGVNTLYQALLTHPDFSSIDFSTLAISLAGGMAATPATAKKWLDTTGCPMVEGWGMSETMGAGTINPIRNTEFNGDVGMPIPGVDISIRDDNENELGLGEVGEICIKGDNVCSGYHNIDNTRFFTADGYLKTGDIGAIFDDGHVKLFDRKKDMLIVSGFNVFPTEIEAVVGLHAKVAECGVVGIEDERQGESVKAYVVKADESLTKDELIDYCRENLTGYKRPRYIEFIDELPKSAVGKILRNKLREL